VGVPYGLEVGLAEGLVLPQVVTDRLQLQPVLLARVEDGEAHLVELDQWLFGELHTHVELIHVLPDRARVHVQPHPQH